MSNQDMRFLTEGIEEEVEGELSPEEKMDELEKGEEEEEEEELSYSDILANLALNGEMIITIPMEMEQTAKNGLINLKAKTSTKARKAGEVVQEYILEFYSIPSKKYEDCIDLHIVLEKKGFIKVKGMRIPDNTL